jgi:hypothetical protein
VSDPQDLQALLREGIEEARLGHREEARELLTRVIEADPDNEKAWFWLASVAESERDRRDALKKVLAINPDNANAQRVLAKMEAKPQPETANEILPGVPRKTFLYVVGGGAAAIVLILLLFVSSSISSNNRRLAEDQAAQQAALASTAAANETSAAIANATATAAALVTDTLEPSRTAIPTWTPTWTPPPFGAQPTPLPPPQGLSGILIGWSGRNVQGTEYLPVGYFNVNDGAFTVSGGDVGRDVRANPSGTQLLYTYENQITLAPMIRISNVNGTEVSDLVNRTGWGGVPTLEEPDYSTDGNWVVFVSTNDEATTPQVYLLDMTAAPEAHAVRRLTNDAATYSYPSLSPDESKVAVVRNNTQSLGGGSDIMIIDVQSLEQTPLTTDLTTFEERSPVWSPDGTQIAYAAAPSNDPDNFDIVLRASSGIGLPTLPVRHDATDVYPVFSPDGRYLAFSSNRTEQFDIFVFDLTTSALAQLTYTVEEDYPGDWVQPGA